MVRKRSNPDLESKMPVKDSIKNKSELQKELESASMSDKDNSDYSSAKATKVWSRELRNRFVIASNKRSLRFTNDLKPGRHVRSCRMAMTSHQHYTLSQSDDDDDDHMFTPRNSSRRMRHQKRRRISPDPGPSDEKRSRAAPVMNGHISKSGREEEEIVEEGVEDVKKSDIIPRCQVWLLLRLRNTISLCSNINVLFIM